MTQHFEPRDPDFAARVRDSFARQGLMAALGIRVAEIAPGRVVLEAAFSPAVAQQHGYFHGAAIGALADSAGGYAAMTLTAAGSEVLSVEYKINFMAPALGDRLRATGRVIKSGRTLLITTIDVAVLDAAGAETPCAHALQTIMRVDG